jgi:HSP20 family molecular chaperone IbpA
MYKNILFMTAGLIVTLPIYAEIDVQKGMYDAGEEMIIFDKKMNRAIAQHNQIDLEDEEQLQVEDFEETESGYRLKRNIPDSKNTKVDVKLADGILIISTSTKEKEILDIDYITEGYESTISSSSISLFLPNDADDTKMSKSYKNGVLIVTFPKK